MLPLLVVMGLSACSPSESQVTPDPGTPSVPTELTPTPGPWAPDFQDLLDRTEHPLVKDVLSDGEMTVTEYMSLGDALVTCLVSQGATGGEVYTHGVVRVETPANVDTNAVLAVCYASMNWEEVTKLWMDSRSNPDRVDWNTLVADCVVRMGARPEGYTSEDYRNDVEIRKTQVPPILEGFINQACQSNPRTELSIYEVQAECLVRSGVREVGYTGQQYQEEFEAGTLPAIPRERGSMLSTEVALTTNCFEDPFYANP